MSLFGQGKPSAASSYHNQFYDIQDNDHSSSNTALPDRLKKAVDYHQAGRLAEAENFYRAILQTQPFQPDANHNLGVLAMQLGRYADGLPHLKIALESNPANQQYWLSYAEALLATGQTKEALSIIQAAIQRGFNSAETQSLFHKIQVVLKSNAGSSEAPDADINRLVALFNAGRLVEMERYARLLIQRYPDCGFAWKALGACLQAQGKESLNAMQRATQLLSDDPDAHFNLGVALQNTGLFDDALVSYRRVLEIQPDYADVYCNMGNALKEMGRLDQALTSYQQALKINPELAEAHYNLGNVLMGQGRVDDAVASYQRALKIKSGLAELHNSLGIALKSLGQFDNAIASYRRATKINPDYAEAHSNLGNVLKELGQTDDAVASYRRALQIKPGFVDAHYNLGNALMEQGRFDDAVASYQRAVEIKPDYADAYNNLGNAQQDLGRFDDALANYRLALRFKPDFAEAHFNLGNILRDLGQSEIAVASYICALEINPDYAEAYSNLGGAYYDLERLDAAEANCRKALAIKHDLAEAHSNLGHVLMELGKIDEAERSLRMAISVAPGEARPISAALLHIPYRADDPDCNQLETVYARRGSLPLEDRIKLNFAMGKAMENIGQYDRSFSAYEEGNRFHYQGHPVDEAADMRFMDKSCGFFTEKLFNDFETLANTLPPTQDKRVPIFIVGMLRSGTTLIEQILASHPAIFGAGELTILGDIAKKIEHLINEPANNEDTLLAFRKAGQEYLDRVWEHAPDARYITDKLPGNYCHLGLIHLMLPNAKIIHCMRDPMDTCFSCYSLRFTRGHEYSYDLRALGRQYLRYRKMMKHWHDALPSGRVLDVRYEDNVADPEKESRRMLDYIGLPWDAACLTFHENKRSVRTASVAQVRKPIYSSSVGRWKHFERHLEPLHQIIGLT